jgi:hypothetical protein
MFPHSPLRTRRASFPATGSPGISFPPLVLPPDLSGSSRSLPPQPSYRTIDYPEIHRGLGSYWTRTRSIPWRPSPCRRLSRPPSTMTPPTPMRFAGGLHPSAPEPPTFTLMSSTEACRWWLQVTHPALRGIPTGERVGQVDLSQPLHWQGKKASVGHPLEVGMPSDAVAAPSGKILRQGGFFP